MKYIDLFAGIGGFRRGMELAGHECVGFCEYDKFAVASYTAMHLITDDQREYLQTFPLKKRQKEILKEEYRNGEWYANDIRSVDARSMPRADCWCFGFPCQDISIAGNCLGFAGKRSSLFFSVTGLIRDVQEEDRPGYLVIENVKNLLSVNRGFDFAKLLVELDEIGYDAEWDVLNSKNFGVPQNRERVFVVGHLRGRGTGKVFPLGETDGILALTTKESSAAVSEESNALAENARQVRETQQARQESINGIGQEYGHYQQLWDELQQNVDANGKVKDGYEERAAFITSTLSNALGVEITMTDGVIDKYGELKESIDSLIEKKRQEAIPFMFDQYKAN